MTAVMNHWKPRTLSNGVWGTGNCTRLSTELYTFVHLLVSSFRKGGWFVNTHEIHVCGCISGYIFLVRVSLWMQYRCWLNWRRPDDEWPRSKGLLKCSPLRNRRRFWISSISFTSVSIRLIHWRRGEEMLYGRPHTPSKVGVVNTRLST